VKKCSKHRIYQRVEKQWLWMMNWCKENYIPPAQKWAWDRAKEAWKTRAVLKGE